MKIFFTILLVAILFNAKTQTNISGGIFSNTTWTKINSPYIVIDTVVVFPGVILTIEPGVNVQFVNSVRLEIRQATIIANGTVNDSITFTSNSGSPLPGIWDGIYLNQCLADSFNYCNFLYARESLYINNFVANDVLILKNSIFNSNESGLFAATCLIDSCLFINNTSFGIRLTNQGIINFCNFFNNQTGIHAANSLVQNCAIKSNQTGIDITSGNEINNCIIDSNIVVGINTQGLNTIFKCDIKNNEVGLYSVISMNLITNNIFENNVIGIKTASNLDSIYCNKICNNITYDFYYEVPTSNINIGNNYWCINDSSILRNHIYDGYTNINLGLVDFMPMDTALCFLTTNITEPIINSIEVFPNPASNYLTFSSTVNKLRITNIFNQENFIFTLHGQQTLNISNLINGIYVIEFFDRGKIYRKKIIVERN
jgi:hypothetical protein